MELIEERWFKGKKWGELGQQMYDNYIMKSLLCILENRKKKMAYWVIVCHD